MEKAHIKSGKLSFFGRMKLGFKISLKSLKFVFSNAKLLFFPFLTVGLVIISIATSIGLYDLAYYGIYKEHITAHMMQKEEKSEKQNLENPLAKEDQETKYQPTLFESLFLLMMSFLIIFFVAFSSVALSHAISNGFRDKPIRIFESLRYSLSRIPTIFVWATCAFIIHLIVSILQRKNKEGQINIVNYLQGATLELGWAIATFLVIPVIAHETIGPIKSIKKSASLMKKTFGENIGATANFSLLSALVFFIGLGAWVSSYFTWLYFVKLYYAPQDNLSLPVMMIPIIITLIISILMLLAFFLLSTAKIVYKTAVYHYAADHEIGLFSQEVIQKSFVKKVK